MATFTSTGEVVPAGHGYEGVELAAFGTLALRGKDVLVNLPGQAMQFCREVLKISDQQICRFFLQSKCKCTRLDVAIDSQDRSITPKTVFDALRKRDFVCTAKIAPPPRYPDMILGEDIDTSGHGMTTYIGKPASVRMMRCYDKAKEWRDKFPDSDEDFPEHCTRFELQNRHEAAQKCAELVAEKNVEALRAVIRGWIDFKDPKHRRVEVKKRRSAPWWNQIVGDDLAYLGLHARAATPLQTRNWIGSIGCARAVKLCRRFGFSDQLEKKIDETDIPEKILKKWRAEKSQREQKS